MPIIREPIIYDRHAIITAYSLEISQTDAFPCLGAGNNNLCDIKRREPDKCIIATRLYSLNTKLIIDGIGECEVLDRTAKKYGDRLDILMNNRDEAIKFGIKELNYKVITYSGSQ